MLRLRYLQLQNKLQRDLRKSFSESWCVQFDIVVFCFASDDLPFEKLKVTVGNSLKTLLTRLRQREEEKANDRDSKMEEVGKTLSSAVD